MGPTGIPPTSFQMSGIIESLLENIGKQPPASYLIPRLVVYGRIVSVYMYGSNATLLWWVVVLSLAC